MAQDTTGDGYIVTTDSSSGLSKRQKIASSSSSPGAIPTSSTPSFSRRQVAMDHLTNYVAKNPSVPVYKTKDLVKRLNESADLSSIVLIDVRTPEERQVSFIPHSISIEEFEALNHDELKRKNVDIVTYCTLGMRSGNFARNLMKNRGFRNVHNGEGVIMWSHDSGGLPFVCKTSKDKGDKLDTTMKVHCFGTEWLNMLNTNGNYDGVVFNTTSFFWHGICALFGF